MIPHTLRATFAYPNAEDAAPYSASPSVAAIPRQLDYAIRSAGEVTGPDPTTEQTRLKGKVVYVPQLDFSRFKGEAVIDWIRFDLTLRETTQGQHLNRWCKRAGLNPRFQAIDQQGKEQGASRTSDRFRCTLQNADARKFAQVIAVVAERNDILHAPVISGLEVAIDFYPLDVGERDVLRDLMVAVLQRSSFPLELSAASPHADCRQFYRLAGEDWQEVARRPRFIFPAANDTDAATAPRRRYSDQHVEHKSTRQRLLRATGDGKYPPQMFLNSTLSFGAVAESMVSVHNKIYDVRRGGDAELLPPNARRARVEVRLSQRHLEELGLYTVDDLHRFEFKTLRKRYFAFVHPLVNPLASRAQFERYERIGSYGLIWYTRAMRREREAEEDANSDVVRTTQRQRQGGRGMREGCVSFRELNALAHKALRSLRWDGDRGAA